MKKYILPILLILAAVSTALSAEQDKDKVLDKFKACYSEAKSISCDFMADPGGLSGSIKATKNNKYVMRMPHRIIFCDGKSIWNYSINDKQVILSPYEENNSSFSVETFFFGLVSDMEALSLTGSNSSRHGKAQVLTLAPKPGSKLAGEIKKLKIKFKNNDPKQIISITIFDGQSEIEWAITKLKINPKIGDSSFAYKPVDGVELIDLR